MKAIHKFFLDLVTGKDGKTHDLGRWMGIFAFFYYHGMESYNVFYMHKDFLLQDYGIGLGAVVAGVGVLLKLKEDTEPEVKENRRETDPPNVNEEGLRTKDVGKVES